LEEALFDASREGLFLVFVAEHAGQTDPAGAAELDALLSA
jgi:hypothetical protein